MVLTLTALFADGFYDLNDNGQLDGVEVFIVYVLATAAVLVALAVIWRMTRGAGRKVSTIYRKADRAFDLWLGTPANPDTGAPAIPGIPERMKSTEDIVLEIQTMHRSNSERIEKMDGMLTEMRQYIDSDRDRRERFIKMEEMLTDLKTKVDHELGHNGGSSTKDNAVETRRLVTQIKQALEESRVSLLEMQAQQEAEKRRTRRDWLRFVDIVGRIIQAPPEEQARVWEENRVQYLDEKMSEETH